LHGAGRPGDDPRRFLGHRVAHCFGRSPAGGYILAELDSKQVL
jgi:hypothetical protein